MAGVAVVGYFVLGHFGYEVNFDYWNNRKAACEEKLTECRQSLIKGGLDGAKENCKFQCIDPAILIKKK